MSPIANEGPDVRRFLEQVLPHCLVFGDVRFYAVLDDAIKDDTLDLLLPHAQKEPRLEVAWAPGNRCVVDA